MVIGQIQDQYLSVPCSRSGEGEASRGLEAGPGRVHVRREDPQHGLQSDEREAGGAVGPSECLLYR